MLAINKINYIFKGAISFRLLQKRNSYSIFGIEDLIQNDKSTSFSMAPVQSSDHEAAVELVKRHFLPEHPLARGRRMDLTNDRAVDEYIIALLKQGNSLFAKAPDESVAGLCVNFAASPGDPQNARNYALYRQDPNTKDFLYYTAKLQETPNLWNIFKENIVFEIKMLAVLPQYRRQGLATMLAHASKAHAKDQGYQTIRMDCINPYDYKIAERCDLSCVVKYPLDKLCGATGPCVPHNSEQGACVRVYVEAPLRPDAPQLKQIDFESMIE